MRKYHDATMPRSATLSRKCGDGSNGCRKVRPSVGTANLMPLNVAGRYLEMIEKCPMTTWEMGLMGVLDRLGLYDYCTEGS